MDWYYLRLQLVVDSNLQDVYQSEYNNLRIELLTWRFTIMKCLNDLYGISGEARYFDILVKQTQAPAMEAIIRIYAEDKDMFKNSFSSYSGFLSDYIAKGYDSMFYVRVVDELPFLGALADESLVGVAGIAK